MTVDLRSLALLRVALAVLLVVDLCRHWPLLTAFYSDAGVMPRGEASDTLWRISLHAANGQTIFESALVLMALLATLALFVGWRSRVACVVSTVLYASLLNRAPALVGGGEQWLLLLLFWSCFLPLNRCWSVDSALGRAAEAPDTPRFETRSWAATALLLQVGMVCLWVTALTPGANPLTTLLTQRSYSTAIGLWLRHQDNLRTVLGWLAYWVGLIAPWLLFVAFARGWLRLLAMVSLALLQVGAIVCFNLGLAPWVGLVALIPFIDGRCWTFCAASRVKRVRLQLFYDAERPRSRRWQLLAREFLLLPSAQVLAAQDHPRALTLMRANASWVVIDADDRAWLRWEALLRLLRASPLFRPLGWLLGRLPLNRPGDAVYRLLRKIPGGVIRPVRKVSSEVGRRAQRFAGLCLLLVLVWNLTSAGLLPHGLYEVLRPPLRVLRLDQPWRGYLPKASPRERGWFVVPGQLADGRKVDLLRPDQAPDFSLPAVLAERQGNSFWHRYLNLLRRPHNHRARARFADYLCRRRNATATPPHRLRSLQIIYLLEHPASEGGRLEQLILWQHQCR